MCEHCTRREFLGTGAVSGLLLAGATWTHTWAAESPPPRPRGKSRICVIFTGDPQPDDRNWGADATQIAAMKTRLAEAEAKLGNVALLAGQSRSPQETQALLEEVPAAYRTQTEDLLLTALTQAVAQWTGSRSLLLDLYGQGREQTFTVGSTSDSLDLSRTVGWFTSIFPAHLDLGSSEQPGDAIKAVKEQLRQIPQGGIGYGLLRYLCSDEGIIAQMRALPPAEISFEYSRQSQDTLPVSVGSAQKPLAALAGESRGPDRSLSGRRTHLLEVHSSIIEGQLQVDWTYSTNLHRRTTIQHVAQEFVTALRTLIAHCQAPEAGGFTASDFAEFEWSEQDLDEIVAELGQLQ